MKKLITTIILLAAAVGSIFAQSTPAKSDAALLGQADQIANETLPGANTALRVGNMLRAIIVSKPNVTYAVTASGTDTYSTTAAVPVTSYRNGDMFLVFFPNTNTGAATLNVSGLGARPIVNNKGEALEAGDIPAGSYQWLIYNSSSTHFKASTIEGIGGGGSVVTVTGDGVDDTDPLNPVINFPTIQEAITKGNVIDTDKNISVDGDVALSIGAPSNPSALQFTGAGSVALNLGSDAPFDMYRRSSTGILERRTASQVLTDISGVPTSRTISTTSPLSGGGDLSANRTLSVANALADGATPGVASFAAAYFNATTGNITPDFTNGLASGSQSGWLSSTDWTTFNGRMQNPMTTAGDIIYGGVSGTPTRLATGTGFLKGGTTPSWSAIDVSTSDIIGRLAATNFVQGSALSVWGVGGNATADQASITAGTDGHVLRRSGTTLGFGTIGSGSVNETIWKVGGNTLSGAAVLGSTSAQDITMTVGNANYKTSVNGTQIINIDASRGILFADGGGTITGTTAFDFRARTGDTRVVRMANQANTMLWTLGSTNGEMFMGTGSNTYIGPGSLGSTSATGTGIVYRAAQSTGHYFLIGASNMGNFAQIDENTTAGNMIGVSSTTGFWHRIRPSFDNSSGTTTDYTILRVSPTFNVTGGSTVLHGIDWNPTETSLTGTTKYGITVGGTNWFNGFNIRTPHSTAHIAGSLALAITTVSSNTTLDATHYSVVGNTTSGNITFSLPSASTCTGRIYFIKKSVAANTLSIDPNGSETIDGVSTNYDLTAQYSAIQLQSDGTNWIIMYVFP